jgi:proteic killer suppression protein
MGIIREVIWGRRVSKQLDKLPTHIRDKFFSWVDDIDLLGLGDVRKRPGWHDEPLSGARKGQRSIRLSRSYRAIYIERQTGQMELLEVIEVSKHEY